MGTLRWSVEAWAWLAMHKILARQEINDKFSQRYHNTMHRCIPLPRPCALLHRARIPLSPCARPRIATVHGIRSITSLPTRNPEKIHPRAPLLGHLIGQWGNGKLDTFKGVRFLSDEHQHVDDEKSEYDNVKWKDMTPLEKTKYLVSQYGTYTAVALGFSYVISKTSVWITSSFLGLSFKTVGFWAFVVGYGSGVGTCAALYMGARQMQLRPEWVRQEAFDMVADNEQVRQLMGISLLSPLRSGVMRAYSLDGGSFAIDKSSRGIVWRRPRIKMIFQVYGGDSHQAVVCVEAKKKGFGVEYDFVSVDLLTKESADHVLVSGAPERFEVENQLRDMVMLKKRYV